MKHVKLFEQFLFEKMSIPKFFMPTPYKIPSGVSDGMVYVLKMDYECGNRIYALVDAAKMKTIYDALNMNMIASKIEWFLKTIAYPKPNKSKYASNNEGNPNYPKEVQANKSWRLSISAEMKSGEFPYYVYIGGSDPTGGLLKKLQDMKKDCKTCGDEPGTFNLTPTEKDEYDQFQIGGIYCFMDDDLVVIDPDMESRFTKKVYPDSKKSTPLDDDASDYMMTGYYVKFDKLSAFASAIYPGYNDLMDRFGKTSVTVGIENILDFLPYKPSLDEARKYIADKENSREVLDSIFSFLIDEQFPNEYISKVAEFLNVDDYEVEMFPYHSLESILYSKQMLNFANPPALSSTPKVRGGRFFVALPGDPQIAKAILNKIPKTYEEIYDRLDSLSPAQLEKLKANAHMSWETRSNEDFLERNLKASVYIVDPSKLEKKEIPLYDGELPSKETFSDETDCSVNYGIYQEVTLDEISNMSPIELYLKIFGFMK
jgi:hypothetical protein